MAALPVFNHGSPERQAAADLDRAFVTLSNYYSPSSGKQAAAIVAKINTLFPDGRRRPGVLWHDGDEPDPPEMSATRREYYLTVVRPVLTDADFLKQLHTLTVRCKTYCTVEQRNAAIGVLEDSLIYWDAIYNQ